MSMKDLEKAEQAVARAMEAAAESQQPRFGGDSQQFFASVYSWVQAAELEAPAWSVDSRKRDAWLSTFWRREPHLAGVLNSVVAIDKNRGWTLAGGRMKVRRYEGILRRNTLAAPDLAGWRDFMATQSMAYYTSDIGAIAEIGREGEGGPLRALYHLDPTKCYLTGDVERPLRYVNTKEPWSQDDYFRVPSLPSIDEDMRGLGICALSRVLDLARLMVAIYMHDEEKLLARAPKGLLLLNGIGEEQWATAMRAREAKLDERERQYFGAVAVLASEGLDTVDAKLVALSQLPDGFNLNEFTNLLMYGYALAFGYDPIEFWPVSAGALGRGRETEIQDEKATGKGATDFILGYQENLQDLLPEDVLFEFEERNDDAQLKRAELTRAWADAVAALAPGVPLLEASEARSLLAEQGIIPAEWTEIEEEVVTNDEGLERSLRLVRQRLLDDARVRRSLSTAMHEPIVRRHWPTGKEVVLWQNGAEALRRSTWQVVKPQALPVQRAEDDVLYQGDGWVITEGDVSEATERARSEVGEDFASLMDNEPYTAEELEELGQ